MKICKNPTCSEDLTGTSDRRFYCNDKCRCAHDYSNRKMKVAIADGLLATLELRKIYKDILYAILGASRIQILPMNHLAIMGIDLKNLLFKPYITYKDDSLLSIDFDEFSIEAFYKDNLVFITIDDMD